MTDLALPEASLPDDGLENAGLHDDTPAAPAREGEQAAKAAALELAYAGHHVHIVGSGESQCQTGDCPTPIIGGLRIGPRH